MGLMKIEHPHSFEPSEVKERLNAMGAYLKRQANLEFTWETDDRASFKGKVLAISFEGAVTVHPAKVEFEGKDPGMLFRGKAQSYIKGKLAKYLDPATPPADLPR